jgi:hypothetical protein
MRRARPTGVVEVLKNLPEKMVIIYMVQKLSSKSM